jgi:Ca2+-transporting ATPase
MSKELGNVVAVTGDGVNDAPALVEGDIGIAVDQKSTDAAKSASDILLSDGNFSTIIAAVEEGRTIFANIRRVTLYLLSTNAVEAVVILLALATANPLPLLPIQILWLNVVTDTFLDVAIGMEPKHANVMAGKPHPRRAPILDRFTLWRMAFLSAIMIVVTMVMYQYALGRSLDLRYVYSITLTTLVVTQWMNSFNVRSSKSSVFRLGLFSNRFHVLALAFVMILHLCILYIPPFTAALHLVPLSLGDWALILIFGSAVFALEEARKYLARHWRRRANGEHAAFGAPAE